MNNISECFNTAKKAVLESGEILRKYFSGNFKINYKGERDPVTIADKESEKAIITKLKKKFPEIKYICEESCNNAASAGSGLQWILDPLDGTVNFVHNFPIFSISLALYKGSDGLFGLIYNPMNRELCYAIKNKGAYADGKKIFVSKIKKLNHSLIVTGFPYEYEARERRVLKVFKKFYQQAEGIRRIGSAAIDLCNVARGRFDGFWEEGLQPWDVAAGAVILKEAGGAVTDFNGGKDYLFGRTLVASNSKIHKNMIKITGSTAVRRKS